MGNCQGTTQTTEAVMLEKDLGGKEAMPLEKQKRSRGGRGRRRAIVDPMDYSSSTTTLDTMGMSSSMLFEGADRSRPLDNGTRKKKTTVRQSRQSVAMACIASGMDPAEVLALIEACTEEEKCARNQN
jgi:hypothetical protein